MGQEGYDTVTAFAADDVTRLLTTVSFGRFAVDANLSVDTHRHDGILGPQPALGRSRMHVLTVMKHQ